MEVVRTIEKKLESYSQGLVRVHTGGGRENGESISANPLLL